MSRATQPKGVRAFACLRFPTPGSQRRCGKCRIAGWDGRNEDDGMSDDSAVTIFTMFAQSLNSELDQMRCAARIDEHAHDRPGWMMLVDLENRRIGPLPDDVSAEAICAFMAILSARVSDDG
jgi:hypothetical protein